ncbi:hypothetical protein [Desulfoscipio sp. XC116]|uniref:hypothetical protein n=1 Tax=Desulfoscipio sp. XC116 TaxID=3144975 RepID=UPI00325B40B0
MKIKKVIAADMQQALLQIRRELGEDAVIISTAKEPVKNILQLFGKRGIEVTAAVDDHEISIPVHQNVIEANEPLLLVEASAPVERNMPAAGGGASKHEMPVRVIPGRLVPTQLPEPIMEISEKGEHNWFNIVLQQEMNKGGAKMDNGLLDKWRQLLRYVEVDEVIIDKLLKDITPVIARDDMLSEDIFKAHLKKRITDILKPAYSKESKARIYSFIGPTGIGKTLTLSKLVTKAKVIDKKKVGLIAVYNHRFGTMERLNFYGKIINVPVDVVMTPGELAQAVEKHRDKEAVFIDTEGRSSMNRSQVLELHTFMSAVGEPQDIHLVLSAPTKNRDLVRIANDFLPIGYNKIIVTKMDETDSYGSMLNIVCDTGLPVAYVSRGQNVPDDIERITSKRLAEIILGGLVTDEDFPT